MERETRGEDSEKSVEKERRAEATLADGGGARAVRVIWGKVPLSAE